MRATPNTHPCATPISRGERAYEIRWAIRHARRANGKPRQFGRGTRTRIIHFPPDRDGIAV